jgi:hypothetical protein
MGSVKAIAGVKVGEAGIEKHVKPGSREDRLLNEERECTGRRPHTREFLKGYLQDGVAIAQQNP